MCVEGSLVDHKLLYDSALLVFLEWSQLFVFTLNNLVDLPVFGCFIFLEEDSLGSVKQHHCYSNARNIYTH